MTTGKVIAEGTLVLPNGIADRTRDPPRLVFLGLRLTSSPRLIGSAVVKAGLGSLWHYVGMRAVVAGVVDYDSPLGRKLTTALKT